MGNWFGNLQLAYKYTIVFVSLLVLTIAAGLAKVLYNRRKMNQYKKEESVEAGRRDDQVELNQREKDEGDLFGVRAIEAGFYAGIPQSRPTSRAGSIAGSPSMSTSTLVGGFNSPKVATHSMASSVTTLPLAHMNSSNRDSETLPSHSPPRNKRSPPTIKLRPSEAEISGRHNHNTAVNMSLNVPPSPVLARGPQSPTFGGSDSGESDGQASPRSLSPNYRPDHYAPVPPQLPVPEGLRATVHEADETFKSQAGSVNDPSPGPSAPPSPGHPPQSKLPSMPHSLFPGSGAQGMGFESNAEPDRPSSPVRLQPQAYQPTHQRDVSAASSVYSQNRVSVHQHKASNSTDISYNYSFPEHSDRNSMTLATSPSEQSRRPSASSSLLAPGSSASKESQPNDPRFSEFYDAYYRHSQLGMATKAEAPRRPQHMDLSQMTIVEVPSPLPSPNPTTKLMQPGMAL